MSAEVVLNEVWTEDSLPPPPIPPISPLSHPPCKRQEEAHRVTKTHGVQQAGRGGREGNGGVNRRERLFFSPYLAIHHHVITARSLLTACERHKIFFFLSWCTSVGCFGVYMRRNVCVQRARTWRVFVWSEAGQAGCVASPGAKKACPLPLIITHHIIIILLLNARQLYSCISMCVCLWMRVFVCMPPRDPRRAAHQQHALDLDEGQHCRSQ